MFLKFLAIFSLEKGCAIFLLSLGMQFERYIPGSMFNKLFLGRNTKKATKIDQ